ncbi:MAG: UbiA family prenyltransferase [Acetivibrionales bacterium]|jgi:1,4-dihydroxy-2-naphthoate octaprenyltransferase
MIRRFLSYVEIKTKITSLFAFLMALAFLVYREQRINWLRTLVFFLSMFLFDLTTTAINNYIDTRTNGQPLQFSRKAALAVIYVLFAASTATGLYLAHITDIVVLILGGICFITGVLYTYGPVPFSRQPLGEILSGVFYGFFIPFLMLYINTPPGTFLRLNAGWNMISLDIMVWPVVEVMLLSVVPACATANIMLANNICDVDRDAAVRRYTLPYYIGNKSLYLFAGLYYTIYAAVAAMTFLKILPPVCLLFLLTIIPVHKNIKRFMERQDKASTFLTSIINYIIIMATITLLIFAGALLRGPAA